MDIPSVNPGDRIIPPQCDCRKLASRAEIKTLDGRYLATVLLKLSEEGDQGWFEPNAQSLVHRTLDQSIYSELIADLGTHRHHILNVRRLVDKAGNPSLTSGPRGQLVVNQNFYFEIEQ